MGGKPPAMGPRGRVWRESAGTASFRLEPPPLATMEKSGLCETVRQAWRLQRLSAPRAVFVLGESVKDTDVSPGPPWSWSRRGANRGEPGARGWDRGDPEAVAGAPSGASAGRVLPAGARGGRPVGGRTGPSNGATPPGGVAGRTARGGGPSNGRNLGTFAAPRTRVPNSEFPAASRITGPASLRAATRQTGRILPSLSPVRAPPSGAVRPRLRSGREPAHHRSAGLLTASVAEEGTLGHKSGRAPTPIDVPVRNDKFQ